MNFKFYDLEEKNKGNNIEMFFNNWQGTEEKIVIYAPHDDDGILGPGYLIKAAQKFNAEVFVFIFCNGCGGYSEPAQKDKIINIRKEETRKAYKELNIKEDNIFRFEYPDFSSISRLGWKLPTGESGSFKKIIPILRDIGATRILIPNGYREHLDHVAVYNMGKFQAPQAGDPILADWGEPTKIKTVMEYYVWGDYSPEDSLMNQRDLSLRANRVIKVDKSVEDVIRKAIKKFESQAQIIRDLIEKRNDRKTQKNKFIETYKKIDPRPSLDYNPYINAIKDI